MVLQANHRETKHLDVVEITAAVPQDQLNTLRQMIFRYILDHNKEEVAYKLLDMTHTRLRDDVDIWINNKDLNNIK
jgi:hypothetical protein